MAVVAYGELVPRSLLDALPWLNLHPSKLPRWRGAAPIERAIMAGEDDLAACVILLVEALDAGPIAALEPFTLEPEEDAVDAYRRALELGAPLLARRPAAAAAGDARDGAADRRSDLRRQARPRRPRARSGRVAGRAARPRARAGGVERRAPRASAATALSVWRTRPRRTRRRSRRARSPSTRSRLLLGLRRRRARAGRAAAGRQAPHGRRGLGARDPRRAPRGERGHERRRARRRLRASSVARSTAARTPIARSTARRRARVSTPGSARSPRSSRSARCSTCARSTRRSARPRERSVDRLERPLLHAHAARRVPAALRRLGARSRGRLGDGRARALGRRPARDRARERRAAQGRRPTARPGSRRCPRTRRRRPDCGTRCPTGSASSGSTRSGPRGRSSSAVQRTSRLARCCARTRCAPRPARPRPRSRLRVSRSSSMRPRARSSSLGPFDLAGSELYERGLVVAQSLSSIAVVDDRRRRGRRAGARPVRGSGRQDGGTRGERSGGDGGREQPRSRRSAPRHARASRRAARSR